MVDYVLELNDIRKVYDNGVVANDGVNFNLKEGEIHAIVGENGAGKSTLMNIVFGEIQPTEGNIKLYGESKSFDSPKESIESGIGMVHQHFKLVDSLTVAQNIFLGIEPKSMGIINKKELLNLAQALVEKYNFKVSLNKLVRDISVGEKQKVEILKSLAKGAKILILDEPTAVLTPQETVELFEELETFKEAGHSIIFISHKLNEVKSISDRITVIRKGKTVKTFEDANVSEADLSNLMVGRQVKRVFEKKPLEAGDVVLKTENISLVNVFGSQVFKDINLTLRQGAIVGIAGVEGNGQSELVESITGLNKNYVGNIFFKDTNINKMSIKEIRNLGISHVPEDRMTDGVALDAKISENFISTKLDDNSLKSNRFIDYKKVNQLGKQLVKDFVIATDSIEYPISSLSGGNMQKVVIAREFSSDPELIVVNQPTRGVDVGSAEFIYKHLIDMRDKGTSILMVSSDLTEILTLSDEIIVMYDGKISGYFKDVSELDEHELGYYMLGVKSQEENK